MSKHENPHENPLAIIIAVAENNVIGRDNELPWHYSEDMLWFRTMTRGNPIIMGSKTHTSIGHVLPGRKNFVLTHQPENWTPGNHLIFLNSYEQALSDARESLDCLLHKKARSKVALDPDLAPALPAMPYIIGGRSLYQEAMTHDATHAVVTRVGDEFEGDVLFDVDAYLQDGWKRTYSRPASSEPHLTFEVWERTLPVLG